MTMSDSRNKASVRTTPIEIPDISQGTLDEAVRLSRMLDSSMAHLASLSDAVHDFNSADVMARSDVMDRHLESYEDVVSAKTLGALEAQGELLSELVSQFDEYKESVERERERSARSERLSKVVAVLSLVVATLSLLGQFGVFEWLLSLI